MTGTKPSSISSKPNPKHASGPAPLSEFRNLGNGILFFDPSPPSPSQNQDNDQPQLIILCTWLGGATPRRIAKYTSGYHRLFPNSPILVIQTVIADFTFRSETQIRRNLGPARDCIREVLSRPHGFTNSAPGQVQGNGSTTGTGMGMGNGTGMGTGILLHIFSNGGCHIANQLAHSFLSSPSPLPQSPSSGLPVTLQILDSSPGTFSISQTYGAAAHSVPSHHPWLLQSIERWGLWGAVVLIAGIQQGLPRAVGEDVVRKKVLGGVGVDFEGMRQQLLDERLWGGGDRKETGRLYLYSKKDEAVGWRDVEKHIGQARRLVKKGGGDEEVLVRAERFENASHCGLVMEDEERYWRAVRKSWEGMMERRVSGGKPGEGRPGEQSESGKIVLGGEDDEGEGQTPGVVTDGDEAREAEDLRSKRTSKL